MARAAKPKDARHVEALTHDEASRRNIPTAELAAVADRMEEAAPLGPVIYRRARPLPARETRPRDPDLDPQIVWNGARIRLTKEQVARLAETGEVEIGDAQLVWRGKDAQDWSDLVVQAPPLYIQEKIHPKVIIDDLRRRGSPKADDASDLFADFNGLDPDARTEFYQHDQHWSNRMILGDSLQVMASLAEREALRGQVQCIYFDPPYGIRFNSNWQVSTLSRDVKDGKQTDISREPEQVKAFRDTWRDGIHSYLTYLRDRLTVMRELLTESGSIFVQIGEENVHRVRAVMDEVFGAENFINQITFLKTTSSSSEELSSVVDFVLWYGRTGSAKQRSLFLRKEAGAEGASQYTFGEDSTGWRRPIKEWQVDAANHSLRVFAHGDLRSQRPSQGADLTEFSHEGRTYKAGRGTFKTDLSGMRRLSKSRRMMYIGNTLRYVRYIDDFNVYPHTNVWLDTVISGFADPKVYVVQTFTRIIERCIMMATDPGDLVLDPTCGSGTTATVAEQWGRRWITIDTSRVALALARSRLMSARYPYYLLADSPEGRKKEQEVSGKPQPLSATQGDIRAGFVYERAPHVTLKSIANNAEIDVIWERWQAKLEPLRAELNAALHETWEEWQIPRETGAAWPDAAQRPHAAWWEARIARQREIDASIAKAADVEFLYDRPYEDRRKVRVAGPFTVESLSPHRVAPADDDERIDELDAEAGAGPRAAGRNGATPPTDFATVVLDHLRTAGVHQAEKRDTIRFTSLAGWPGQYVGAEGHFTEGERERRAAIFIGPEFGTVSRIDLVAAAREATEARFDLLIACAFAFDAHSADLTRLGPLAILKAKMNPDLHMADDLKNTGKGNLFVVFGEPDIDIEDAGEGQIRVKVKGVDVFDPNTGTIRSDDTAGIAAWFIDTDYNEESFFVRHAYFLGAQDPYKSLKTALRAEIDEAAWATLYRDTSRPFPRPSTSRIAVKVINHFGDEVMKVFGV
ncbi:site-specific DNA-methyltransferase [uncultured Enterovirga sp.]|uniref:site-specific DNA-methyltransferase n=1 Tax=uncultured Enterovirga sp. TaxID=2026352 RepID=UPI0035CC8F50